MSWSAKQYSLFESQRTRPVRDLLATLPPIAARRVIDIGCGPGNSTELLAARYPAAAVTAIDSSPDMIVAARARLPRVAFELADIERWVDAPGGKGDGVSGAYDVILANAVLQWLPDHGRLFPALAAKLTVGGALAVQMPDNLADPAHVAMREIAASGPWRDKLLTASAARPPFRDAEWYVKTLRAAGCEADVWRTTYHHVLAGGAPAIVEWFKGSGLRPYLERLEDAERAEYLRLYGEAMVRAYPPLSDGAVVLPFPRLFIVAVR